MSNYPWNSDTSPAARMHRVLSDAFGSINPRITAHPHCIFPGGPAALAVVVDEIDDLIGVWGNCSPRISADGSWYAPPWYDPAEEARDFLLWMLPVNQEYALEIGGDNIDFTMVIPAATPESLLKRMYASDHGADQYDRELCMELTADWMDELGWAYIPLGYECEYVMFVTSAANVAWRDRVRARLAQEGVEPIFETIRTAAGQIWTGPLYLE